MYDLLDRPVADLGAFDRPLLGAMRRWVHAMSMAGGCRGTGDAPLDRVMRALDEGSGDDLLIHLPCHATIGESEAVLLGLWRLVRDGRGGAARATAAMIVDEDRVAPLLGAMESVIRA